MSIIRILGWGLAVVGLLAVVFPSWFAPLNGSPEAAFDVFEAVERRVRGGMVLGLGMALVGVRQLRPWSMSIPIALLYFLGGALGARFLGLALDGSVPMQWVLVGVELAAMGVAALWLWRRAASPD